MLWLRNKKITFFIIHCYLEVCKELLIVAIDWLNFNTYLPLIDRSLIHLSIQYMRDMRIKRILLNRYSYLWLTQSFMSYEPLNQKSIYYNVLGGFLLVGFFGGGWDLRTVHYGEVLCLLYLRVFVFQLCDKYIKNNFHKKENC